MVPLFPPSWTGCRPSRPHQPTIKPTNLPLASRISWTHTALATTEKWTQVPHYLSADHPGTQSWHFIPFQRTCELIVLISVQLPTPSSPFPSCLPSCLGIWATAYWWPAPLFIWFCERVGSAPRKMTVRYHPSILVTLFLCFGRCIKLHNARCPSATKSHWTTEIRHRVPLRFPHTPCASAIFTVF